MSDYDTEGYAIPGTYPISVVDIGMWKSDGTPVPTVRSAICDVCGGWASVVWAAGKLSTTSNSLTDARISRRVEVTVYACPEHSDEVSDALVNEWGSASNRCEVDDLALKVSTTADRHHARQSQSSS